jgi:hypothetical protein
MRTGLKTMPTRNLRVTNIAGLGASPMPINTDIAADRVRIFTYKRTLVVYLTTTLHSQLIPR